MADKVTILFTRFDHAWSPTKREAAIEKMEVLADTEVLLPRRRQSFAQLNAARAKAPDVSPAGMSTVDVVLTLGGATLGSLGDAAVTPWPGPRELAALMDAVRTATSAEAAEMERCSAERVVAVVDRDLLRQSDELLQFHLHEPVLDVRDIRTNGVQMLKDQALLCPRS